MGMLILSVLPEKLASIHYLIYHSTTGTAAVLLNKNKLMWHPLYCLPMEPLGNLQLHDKLWDNWLCLSLFSFIDIVLKLFNVVFHDPRFPSNVCTGNRNGTVGGGAVRWETWQTHTHAHMHTHTHIHIHIHIHIHTHKHAHALPPVLSTTRDPENWKVYIHVLIKEKSWVYGVHLSIDQANICDFSDRTYFGLIQDRKSVV